MNPILNIAVKAARSAGKIILRYADRLDGVKVEAKGRGDFVSEVDRMAEAEIVDAIRARYPDHAIVAEESAGALARAPDFPEVEWIVDPLDGTANYLHGHPHFAVSIGVRQNGRLEFGVVYDPLRDEMFVAARGQGAQVNDRRIRVTRQNKLNRALLASACRHSGRSGGADFVPWLRSYQALLPRIGDVRRSGSAALDLAYVAAGRLDGYWQPGLQAWDTAAGVVLVREAGGLVADFGGEQNFLESGRIIAVNQLLFGDVLLAVREAYSGDADDDESAA